MKMFNIIRPDTHFDFAGQRRIWIAISGLAVIGALVLIFTKGLNFGIDFSGGAELHVQVPQGWDVARVRSALSEGGQDNARVQQIGEPDSREFLIRVQAEEAELRQVAGRVEGALSKEAGVGGYQILRADVVGPAAGSALRKNGLLALVYALLVILVYVAVRFDMRYAPGAVMALFHDSMIILGIFVLTQKEFDLTILAAILALAGYSNNDTIVVYDRVRETLQMHPEYTIEEAVNRSINETLGRTIMTALTTFLTVMALFFWGGPVLHNFAFALMIGLAVGTYSTVFVASGVIIEMTRYQKKRMTKLKASGALSKKRKYQVRPEPKFQA